METVEKRIGQGREKSRKEGWRKEEDEGRQKGEREIVELSREPYFNFVLLCELEVYIGFASSLCCNISFYHSKNIQKYLIP